MIKQRFSDFVVNEIANNGEIVRLTSTDLPQSLKQEEKTYEKTPADQEGIIPPENAVTVDATPNVNTETTDITQKCDETGVEEKTPISQEDIVSVDCGIRCKTCEFIQKHSV